MTKVLSQKIYRNLPAPKGYQSFINTLGPTVCDLYALTMTYASWRLGFAEERVTTSHVFCRSLLTNGETYVDSQDKVQRVEIPYLVNAGAGLVAEWLDGWKWKDSDLRFLAQQDVPDGKGNTTPLFSNEFLHWLSGQKITLDIDAVPEGELVFPQEPVLRLKGLWWQQEMVEAANLHLISSSTNLTTVAVQVRLAAQREAHKHGADLVDMSAASLDQATLSEMALRRGMSIGGIQSTRAAAIAGWNNTSNVFAAKCYGVPVMGTFAHAWVMLHDTEEEAFENWAKVFPGSTVFLADTYDTIEGVKTAIRICKKYNLDLRAIRLDSGDMEYLSVQTRELLAEAGYKNAAILATDNINRKTAGTLYRNARSEITGMGIGSEVAVNRLDPLLGFVQKLGARFSDYSTGRDDLIREFIKLGEGSEKTTIPGELDAIRYIDRKGMWAGDTIIPKDADIGEGRLTCTVNSVHTQTGRVVPFPQGAPFIRLLQPWMIKGDMVSPAYRDKDSAAILQEAKETCKQTMARMDSSHLALPPSMPKRYGVGIARDLARKKEDSAHAIRSASLLERQRTRFNLNAA